ncbi:hypothetical protein Slin14017_G099090 [Septoria linicola]|nr:hypothetical protein Slin14017_G099090 [Septoria linicola]
MDDSRLCPGIAIPQRKPVPLRSVRSTPALKQQENISARPPRYEDLFYIDPYPSQLRPDDKKNSRVSEHEVCPSLDQQLEDVVLITDPQVGELDAGLRKSQSERENASKSDRFKSAVGTALNDAKHFAGGLVSHPFEATKHYAILRHSLGLVYYRGHTTSVTITIFSDRPLPANRRLYIQRRGYSGKTGLAVGATLGIRSAWIDVTPVDEICADQVRLSDERAFQRDIIKFMTKAKTSTSMHSHRPAETLVIRIPAACEDGYFRIVLLHDGARKVLCPSPVFRCASASMDPSVLRGASLRTLPLELGIRAGAVVATKAATVASHKALGPTIAAARGVSKLDAPSKLPLHWLGVRSEAMLAKDAEFGQGGVYIRR